MFQRKNYTKLTMNTLPASNMLALYCRKKAEKYKSSDIERLDTMIGTTISKINQAKDKGAKARSIDFDDIETEIGEYRLKLIDHIRSFRNK